MSKNQCKHIEWLILKNSNIARKKRGIQALKRNRGLTRVARRHSKVMSRRGRVFHGNGPKIAPSALTFRSFWDSLSSLFTTYSSGGENCHMLPVGLVRGHGRIKSNKDIARAIVKDWLRSPGHRRNLLDSSFTYIGIGVAKKGRRFYATQLFYG